jgi:hypothetical protein
MFVRVAGAGLIIILMGTMPQVASAQVSALEVMKAAAVCVALEAARGNQVLLVQIDVATKGFTRSQTLTLQAGSKYRIYAIGDGNRIVDIDLSVDDADGNEVGKDNDFTNVAIVEVRVAKTQQYTLKAHPFRLKDGIKDGFFAFIVVRID